MGCSGRCGPPACSWTVTITSPAPRTEWRRVLDGDPLAVATQTPEWLDCLCARTGRTDAGRLYELPGGRRGVLPLVARTFPSGSTVALTQARVLDIVCVCATTGLGPVMSIV